MTARFLVVGMNAFDSGKTILAGQLVRFLNETNRVSEYFKPVSGHNYWYRFYHTQWCLENCKLISYDTAYVRKISDSKVDPFLSNPVHRLVVPAKLRKPESTLPTTLSLGGWDSVVAMQRFSRPGTHGVDSVMLIAKQLISQDKLLLTSEMAEQLSKNTTPIPVKSLEEVQAYEAKHLESTVIKSFEVLENSAEAIVIESFNNAAWPWEGLDFVDRVIVVGPGQVFLFDPERFRKAAFLINRGASPIRAITFM